MSGNYKGYDGQCFVGYVADQLGLDRDHAINLGLPAVMTRDLADLIETGAMPAMNHYSGVQYTSVPELKEYIQKAELITLQIGANDALIRTIVALGEATNWKSEKLANSMVTGMFRNLTPDNIDYFMDCLKQLTLTPSEFRAVMHLLTTGMNQICTSTYADTVTQLERVMKDLRELNPEAQIMILSYNNPVPLMPSWSRHFRRLNTAAAKLAAQYDVTYVPIPYTRTANDGHPTVSGHKYIGRPDPQSRQLLIHKHAAKKGLSLVRQALFWGCQFVFSTQAARFLPSRSHRRQPWWTCGGKPAAPSCPGTRPAPP